MSTLHKRIAYRNMDNSPQVEHFINERISKIEESMETERTPKSIDLVMTEKGSGILYQAELQISTPDYNLYMSREGTDLYKQIDEVIDGMLNDIREAKNKKTEARRQQDSFKSA